MCIRVILNVNSFLLRSKIHFLFIKTDASNINRVQWCNQMLRSSSLRLGLTFVYLYIDGKAEGLS
jgi:hypothetical protein